MTRQLSRVTIEENEIYVSSCRTPTSNLKMAVMVLG
jgi:hypothetical protein